MRVLTPFTYVQDSDAQKLHSASLDLKCNRCFSVAVLYNGLSLCSQGWPGIHYAIQAGLEYMEQKEGENQLPECVPWPQHTHWDAHAHNRHTHTHIFLNRKWTTKLESVLLSNPEFQTTLQGSPVLYLLSQTSMLFFYLNMQIRKPFALISLRNYRFPAHRSQIICAYK